MADTTAVALVLEAVKDLGPTITLVVVGVLVFRQQERVKRQEEYSAAIRKVQFEALREVVEATGRYHMEKTWRATEERDSQMRPRDAMQAALVLGATEREKVAFRSLVDLLALKQFVLGGEAGRAMMRAAFDLGKAKDRDEQEAAYGRLEQTIARWIPPLSPESLPEGSRIIGGPPVWAMIMLWAAILWSIFWR